MASSPLIKECAVANGQNNTFTGAWASRPVPVAVRTNNFNAAEKQRMMNAIQTWNAFFKESKGYELYWAGSQNFTESDRGTYLAPEDACDVQFASTTGYNDYVVISKVTSGWSNSQTTTIALTGTCPVEVGSSRFKMMVSGAMSINYQDYFKQGKPQPDLESVVLHELGHLLGLKHSCGQDLGVSCDPAELKEAVMFPSLSFNGITGEIKKSLKTNDMKRANCLY